MLLNNVLCVPYAMDREDYAGCTPCPETHFCGVFIQVDGIRADVFETV